MKIQWFQALVHGLDHGLDLVLDQFPVQDPVQAHDHVVEAHVAREAKAVCIQ